MQDLQLIGVHEDGKHLLLSGPEGERFQMDVDDALRAAIRRDRPRLGQLQNEVDAGLGARDVQALIRAGSSSDEAARRAGWSVEKVHRFEGPILAEREHVAGLAQQARLRLQHGFSGSGPSGLSGGASAPTLSARVSERLSSRDVEVTDASWDSWRTEGGPWTVVLTFAAGGRQRQASWSFNLADRTVSAIDDEARWLSEEVQETTGPIPAQKQRPTSSTRATSVYDVDAEGGLRPADPVHHQEDPLDLMTAMRRRSTARARRTPGVRSSPARSAEFPVRVPDTDRSARDQALPLEDVRHEAESTMPRAEPATLLEIAGISEDDFAANESAAHSTSSLTGESDARTARQDQEDQESRRRDKSKARAKRPTGEAARRTGRPSVPAWDEIMFGSRPGGDR